MMLGKAVLCLTTLQFYSIAAQEQCTDLRGRSISHGLHYVPGPDTCTLCVCDNGLPKVCKAVLCSPPQDCRSFRVGNTCCEFICLDDVVKPAESAEANVRMAAGGAAAVVLLTVALVVYRVRKQKRRRPPHADDQRSLTSIGYISGSMGYMGSTCETALAAWKPPSNYLPRGEAPPPYDEAVAQCRPETMRLSNESAFHRSYPAAGEALARPDDGAPCAGHGYPNMPRPLTQIANPQGCYNAPLLQSVLPSESREPTSMPHHPIAANMAGFPSAIRLTGSLGAISSRGLLAALQREPDSERPHNVPGFYTNAPPLHTSLHRTIPRIATAAESALLDAQLGGFQRGERALLAEVRRSFHRAPAAPRAPPAAPSAPAPAHAHAHTGRSMPRNLNLAAADCDLAPADSGRAAPRARSEQDVATPAPPPAPAPLPAPTPAPTPAPAPAPHAASLPLTVDKPSCVCSYAGAAPGAEDADDYRNECENCKSASGSRWVSEEGWEGEREDGTQTLQRRAPPPPPPPPATATLPQPVTKQSRTVMGPPSNWENWFNTIPDSDTETEEE